MNLTEAAVVLAKAAAFDRRTVGDADILAWHDALSDVAAGDCLAAVTEHYRGSTEWLMPAHVRRIANDLNRARRQQAREQREAADLQAAIAASPLRDRAADVTALVEQLRDRLPASDPDKLRRKEWSRHRERLDRVERSRTAVTNPLYDPAALQRAAEMLAAIEQPPDALPAES